MAWAARCTRGSRRSRRQRRCDPDSRRRTAAPTAARRSSQSSSPEPAAAPPPFPSPSPFPLLPELSPAYSCALSLCSLPPPHPPAFCIRVPHACIIFDSLGCWRRDVGPLRLARAALRRGHECQIRKSSARALLWAWHAPPRARAAWGEQRALRYIRVHTVRPECRHEIGSVTFTFSY